MDYMGIVKYINSVCEEKADAIEVLLRMILKDNPHYKSSDLCINFDEDLNILSVESKDKKLNYEVMDICYLLRKVYDEKEAWKGFTCRYDNKYSILSMDCQIVHNCLSDLELLIDKEDNLDVYLKFKELREKFDLLWTHQLR